MKKLTIYTANHESYVKNFVAGIDIIKTEHKKPLCITWQNENHNQVVSHLATLLQQLAAKENPIYKSLPKMMELAKNLSTQNEEEAKRLKYFLKTSRRLNIEGYITFRMSDYRHKLDILGYRVIKKLRLMQEI